MAASFVPGFADRKQDAHFSVGRIDLYQAAQT
jgi:hypothetical protein